MAGSTATSPSTAARQQINDVRADAEFQRNMVDANMIVDELGIDPGWVNDGIANQMAMFQEAIAKVPQRT